jgi:hypothetical protein
MCIPTDGLALLTETLLIVLVVETELRFLVRNFVNEASELSARNYIHSVLSL